MSFSLVYRPDRRIKFQNAGPATDPVSGGIGESENANVTVTVPSNVKFNDLMFVVVKFQVPAFGAPNIVTPSGWGIIKQNDGRDFGWYWKYAGLGETGNTYTWNYATFIASASACISVFRNIKNLTPDVGKAGTTTSTTIGQGELVNTEVGSWLMFAAMCSQSDNTENYDATGTVSVTEATQHVAVGLGAYGVPQSTFFGYDEDVAVSTFSDRTIENTSSNLFTANSRAALALPWMYK